MTLKELRRDVIGYRLETVFHHTGIPLERLKSIEDGDAPDVSEIEALATVYGIPSDILSEEPIRFSHINGVHLLARRNEFQEWNEHIRYRIVQISNTARDIANLRALVGEPDAAGPIDEGLPAIPQLRQQNLPWEQGRDLAHTFRAYFSLGEAPIHSIRDLVQGFSAVSLLYSKMGEYGPAGLTFADTQRSAVLALNLDGKNTNPTTRRVSLAHELCHLWVDWPRPEPLATISGYPSPRQLEVEKRANSFAIRLLCPEAVINRHLDKSKDGEKTAEFLIREFGLPYSAAQNYLHHTCHVTIPLRPAPQLRHVGIDQYWERHEAPEGLSSFPLQEVPMERRTVVARYAAYLYGEGRIKRDHFAELLGVPPTKKLEAVLDFFDIALPDDTL